ncbi:LysR family transcriptional regulator [Pseudomonas sp. SG-MS2]|uniref:LysR family transcriptional regulator n=1 Tax=Pseudomonas putida TaxID=303 RepID=A0A7Y8D2T0_PSEPU|nr:MULTISPECIES: LysR family transcriptional regulator [Pseudomonas]KAF1310693.1 LysR family transcriptional regulator [Pseudomonas sp. SG-MS2]NWC81711.1 LysR family transcriptional regulator [Pseudomonas putida]
MLPALSSRGLVNRLRYKHLLMLVTLGNSQNLHRAAEALSMSQPATTRMLQEIEEAFGCALFERKARGMQPTALGKELLRYARAALNGLDRCAAELAERQAGGYGFLAIGAILSALPDLVIDAIGVIKQRHPLLRLKVLGDTSDQLIELLEQRRVDVAVARLGSALNHKRFEFQAIGNERLIAVVRAGHPAAKSRDLPLEDLIERWPWILQPDSAPARIALDEAFARQGLAAPTDIIECSSVFTMLQLMRITDGILVISENLLSDHLSMGLIVKLDLPLEARMAPFGILLRRNETLTAELEEFLEEIYRRTENRVDAHWK